MELFLLRIGTTLFFNKQNLTYQVEKSRYFAFTYSVLQIIKILDYKKHIQI